MITFASLVEAASHRPEDYLWVRAPRMAELVVEFVVNIPSTQEDLRRQLDDSKRRFPLARDAREATYIAVNAGQRFGVRPRGRAGRVGRSPWIIVMRGRWIDAVRFLSNYETILDEESYARARLVSRLTQNSRNRWNRQWQAVEKETQVGG